MRRLLPALFAVAVGCSDPIPPAPPPAPKPKPMMTAPPSAPSPQPAPVAQVPLPAPLPPPPPAPPPPPPAPPPIPRYEGPVGETQSPAFTLRAMDHSTPEIAINGRRHALLPVSWWVSALTDFDPLIPVTTWPPEGAAYRGSAKWVDEDLKRASSLELYIAGGRFTDLAGLRKRYPHLDPAEHVFFARATIEGKLYQGAVRVKILGPEGAVFRYVTFDPSSSDEDPRFKRAVWFEKD